jgi:hypothetical protein
MPQLLLMWLMVFSTSSDPSPLDPLVSLAVDGEDLPAGRTSFLVMPGDTVLLSSPQARTWSFTAGSPSTVAGQDASWECPRRHGVYYVSIASDSTVQDFTILVPVESCRWRTESLNSFQIGCYGEPGSRSHIPPFFVELTQAAMGARLSTHFTIGEFLGHVEGDYPQYMALDLALVDKLEALIDGVEGEYPENVDVNIMSGFRTPAYNAAIGNETDQSMHLYGKAADIWIESFPPNNLMDDVDRNKRVDVCDGEFLVDLTRRIEVDGEVSVGGASAYRWTPQHGPFVHIDVRGRPACWQTQRNLVPDPVI